MTDTLFAPLPDDLTAKPDAAEADVLARWRADDVFGALQRARADAPPFVFWEGPPTASGRPGSHHGPARTLQQLVQAGRFHPGNKALEAPKGGMLPEHPLVRG